MGVYIPKLMDMPEHCYECPLRQGNCCLLLYEAIPPTVPLARLDDCPLIDIVTCGECKHRDPEDKKCDCGMFERQGCIFPVADDYFCKYGERRSESEA